MLDDTGGGPGAPAWSPDGSSIAVGRIVCEPGTEMPYCGGAPGFLETVQVADGSSKRLVSVASGLSMPLWSPDGRRIAYTDDTGLYVVGADGSGALRLVEPEAGGPPGSLSRAQWSPD